MPLKRVAAVTALAAIALLSGCSNSTSTSQPTSARAAVESYIAAWDSHDLTKADSHLSPHERSRVQLARSRGHESHVGLSDVTIVGVRPALSLETDFPGYDDVRQVTVSFTTTFSKARANRDGRVTTTIIAGRDRRSGMWKLLGPDGTY